MKINIIDAILKLNSTAQVSVSGDDINTLEWHDGNPTNITNKQILDKQKELQAIEDVISKRIKEYGSIAEQIEYITENAMLFSFKCF